MDDLIRLSLSDWQYNAGIVGMYNVLKHSGKDIYEYTANYINSGNEANIIAGYELCFPREYLNDFTDNYYRYMIDTYINQISYGRILSYKETAERILLLEDSDFEDSKFSNELFEGLNSYIKDTLKYYIKSASYKAAFELIPNSDILLNRILNLNTIKKGKKETILEKKDDIISVCNEILEIINILEGNLYRKYLGGKNIIYTYLRRNWDGISILNKQVKEKDIYKEFNNHFVKPTVEYLCADKAKYKYKCFNCDSPIKNLDINYSFLTDTGFDTARKSSHVWFFQNDIAICEFCKLVYACMPAGFVYGFDKGIFINSNANIDALISVNSKLKADMDNSVKNKDKNITYRSIVEAIIDRKELGIQYELSDVQVVWYENEKYRFNILHESILRIIYTSKEEFRLIKKATFKENKVYIYLYEETLKRIFNNQNLFLWINKLIHYYITNKSNCYYNISHVERILKINFEYLKGVGLMENIEKDIIEKMRTYGYYIGKEYFKDGSDKKIVGLSHQMLNALKTNNVNTFMDLLIRAYMYVKKEIPKDFINSLKTEEEFKTNGYAFVMGLNSYRGEISDNK
ncbi:type I-B CRISPR-associated protein Cas8b1/Cst1 [Peptoniphilus mikwangii]|uniref:type I-B CRISPR-associated protein Cas8b1/Cst1 n=1 Tax=Peptoniphilus mikwangii TaxID=1354300 RepID=UPI000400F1B6|nr:type I-B CRISPR-associated protein Cas8b1/Cst1 [Peptoniphilus mikwangii]